MARQPTHAPGGPTITPAGSVIGGGSYGFGGFDTQAAMEAAVGHHQQGRLGEAAAIYRRILEVEPTHVGALHSLGVVSLEQGDPAAAADLLTRAVETDDGNAELCADLGVALTAAERPDEGLDAFRRAARLKPGYAEAHYNVGRALADRGDLEDAAKSFKKAIRHRPGYAEAHMNLGLVLTKTGRSKKALPHLRKAVALAPGDIFARINLGTVLLQCGEAQEAVRQFEKAVEIDPGHAAAHCGLGDALEAGAALGPSAEKLEKAEHHYRRALDIAPDYFEAHNNLGNLLKFGRRLEEAEKHYRRALELRPGQIETAANIAEVLMDQDRDDEALALYRTLHDTDPHFAYACERIARLLQEKGAFEKARDMIEELRAIDPASPAVFTLLSAERGHRFSAEEVGRAEAMARDRNLPEEDRIRLLFALARAFEAGGDFDAAFAHLQEGNALVARTKEYDSAAEAAFVEMTVAAFTPEFLAERDGFGIDSDRPVFIVGMLRSGTTLVEQIIASHPRAVGGGEPMDIPDMAAALPKLVGGELPYPRCIGRLDADTARRLGEKYLGRLRRIGADADRVTDKLPTNFRHLGLIALLFPKARVIHCRRHPVDNCLSLYLQHFRGHHPYAYGLDRLAHYYRQYGRLMEHWRRVCPRPILECRYEDLVADQEAKSREIIDFLGLPWDDRCLRFFETERRVKTASMWQVRQPIYESAVGRWKNYEKHLGPLIEALDEG